MSETLPTPHQRLSVQLLSANEQLRGAEFSDLRNWFKEQAAALPEMKLTRTPLVNDEEKWNATVTPDGKVDSIKSPFFSFVGVDVATDGRSWHQGVVAQRSEYLPTKSGEVAQISGVVLLLTNPKGETLVTLSQEPLAPAQYRGKNGELTTKKLPNTTEIHPTVRASVQTSLEKLQLIARNNQLGAQYDAPLTKILTTIAKDRGESVMDLLNTTSFSKTPTDGNRILSDVVYGTIAVHEGLAQKLTDALPGARWMSQRELDALTLSGLTNGHLNIARSVTESSKRLAQ